MSILLEMFPLALVIATPIIISAIGGLYSERSGVINIALEGIMAVGGFAGATTLYFLEPIMGSTSAVVVALIVATIAGCLYSWIHAFASITLNADQTISGTALNVLAGGLTIYLCQIIFGAQETHTYIRGIPKITVPVLSDIPVIGELFFTGVYPTTYLAIFLVVITYFIMFKTPFGLRLRSCGEYPQASASMGINVKKMRYFGVMASGALAGLSGAVLVLSTTNKFNAVSIHGIGFIAIATMIFGKWKPAGIVIAGLFFGFSQTLGYFASDISFLSTLPQEVFWAFPYVITIIALVLFSGKSVGPKAAGEVYDAGKR